MSVCDLSPLSPVPKFDRFFDPAYVLPPVPQETKDAKKNKQYANRLTILKSKELVRPGVLPTWSSAMERLCALIAATGGTVGRWKFGCC
jgi:hypothetical protein